MVLNGVQSVDRYQWPQRAAISPALSCTHDVSRSTASRSTTTVPIGGICEIGRRDLMRRMSALDSGCPGLIDARFLRRLGNHPVTALVDRRRDARQHAWLESRLEVCRHGPDQAEDAIELSRLWQLPQLVER